MSYSPDEDPEVQADLDLRESTAKDPTRMREMPVWNPPKIVDKVPCRARCGRLVDWSEEAEHAFETFNRQLASRVEAPLDKTRIAFCPSCVAAGRALAGDSNRKHVDMLAAKIRELKASDHPDEERDLIAQIRKLRHPDVEGLLEAIRAKRENTPARRRVKATDVR